MNLLILLTTITCIALGCVDFGERKTIKRRYYSVRGTNGRFTALPFPEVKYYSDLRKECHARAHAQ